MVTVTALEVDSESIAAGLGSCGRLELWDRRAAGRLWGVTAHKEGIYCVALGRGLVASGGQDNAVRVWDRDSGAALATLSHHTYIVWAVRLTGTILTSASYDCSVCWVDLQPSAEKELEPGGCDVLTGQLVGQVQGPWDWAEALWLAQDGELVVVQDEEVFSLTVWAVRECRELSTLSGHTDEVNCVEVRGGLAVSGGSDCAVRLWDWRAGRCLSVLSGHRGKVWSVALDRWRIASGGRYGEVRVWHLQPRERSLVGGQGEEEDEDEEEQKEEDLRDRDGRALFVHPYSTSVASIHLDRLGLVSGDGLALLVQWDFWASQQRACPCTKYTQTVNDSISK